MGALGTRHIKMSQMIPPLQALKKVKNKQVKNPQIDMHEVACYINLISRLTIKAFGSQLEGCEIKPHCSLILSDGYSVSASAWYSPMQSEIGYQLWWGNRTMWWHDSVWQVNSGWPYIDTGDTVGNWVALLALCNLVNSGWPYNATGDTINYSFTFYLLFQNSHKSLCSMAWNLLP